MHIIFSPITMLKSIKNCLYKYCTLYRITFCNILILNSSSHVHEERNGKQRRSLNEAQVARAVHVACGALRSSSRKWQEQCCTVHDSEDCYVRDVSELVIRWRKRENTEGQVRVGQGTCEENAKDIKWRAKGSLKVGGK